MGGVVVYTCDTARFDWVHTPMAPTPGARFVRYAPERVTGQAPWQHRPLPPTPEGLSPRMISRYPKIMPHRVLADAEITIWIDASTLVMTDLTPLVEQFRATGADLALFRHPSGRTVSEEFDFCYAANKIRDRDMGERQRRRYAEAGVGDTPISENTILFRRGGSRALDAAMECWWDEMRGFTERDQVSLPFALAREGVHVHYWDWHFKDDDNPWFRRLAHRPAQFSRRLLAGAHVLGDYRWEYRMLRSVIDGTSAMRRRLNLPSIRGRIVGPNMHARDHAHRGEPKS